MQMVTFKTPRSSQLPGIAGCVPLLCAGLASGLDVWVPGLLCTCFVLGLMQGQYLVGRFVQSICAVTQLFMGAAAFFASVLGSLTQSMANMSRPIRPWASQVCKHGL